jgi:hypothetical protein
MDASSGKMRSTSAVSAPGTSTAEVMEFLWTSRPTNVVENWD